MAVVAVASFSSTVAAVIISFIFSLNDSLSAFAMSLLFSELLSLFA